MKLVKGIGIGVVAAVIGLVAFSGTTNAQTTQNTQSPTTAPSEPETTTTQTTPRQKITEARCTVAEAKIETRSTRITTSKDMHDKKFKGIIERVSKLTEKAKEQGYDTTELEGAKTKTQAAVDAYKTAFDTYKASLATTKTFACGESEGAFATALAKARTDLIATRTAAQALKTAVTGTVIPAIKDYAAWLKVQVSTTTSDDTTKATTEGAN